MSVATTPDAVDPNAAPVAVRKRSLLGRIVRSIAFRAILVIVSAEVVVLGAIGAYFMDTLDEEFIGRAVKRVSTPGKLMQIGVLTYSAVGDYQAMTDLSGEELVDGLIVGSNGNIFDALNPGVVGRNIASLPSIDPGWFDAERTAPLLTEVADGNHTYLISVTPLIPFSGVKPHMFAYIKVDTTSLIGQREWVVKTVGIGMLACVVVTSLVIYLGFHSLALRRLHRATHFIDRVRAGNLDARVRPLDDSELGMMEAGLSSMAASLEAGRNEILELNQDLERRVVRRTAELEREAEQHRHTAEMLRRAKEEADKANLAKTKFLAAASHDLRQPLQAIGLFLAALSQGERDPDKVELIDQTAGSLDALRGLLNSILDVSKLEAGLVTPKRSAVAVGPLLTRLSREFSALAEECGLTLRAVPADLIVDSDPILLETILRNLLHNAVKYTDEGRILIGVRRRGPVARIEVWDTGRGIPEDQRERIFQEFHQVVETASDHGQGLGLGLSIVDRLARLLDHRIEVRSTVGRGSMFALELPLAVRGPQAAGRRTAPASGTRPPAVATPSSTLSIRPGVVAVIDDDPLVLGATRTALERWGHTVVTASEIDPTTGRPERLLAALDRAPDLIVADYRLQGGTTGLQAIAAIREAFAIPIPALVITGETGPDRLSTAQDSGFPVLHKPLDPSALLQAVDRAIASLPLQPAPEG